jgi:drug/metabolite transporter (DMT)-like permease
MKKELGLILTSVFMGALAQLLLKTGMNAYGSIGFGIEIITALFQPFVFLGLLTYFLSSLFWIKVLRTVDVSYAYPFASLGYGIVALLGWLFLGEQINVFRVLGISVIISGVYLVGKSK